MIARAPKELLRTLAELPHQFAFPGPAWKDLSAITPGCPPPDAIGFEQHDIMAAFGEKKR